MKKFFSKYKHAWPLLYIFIYFPWFLWLEQRDVTYTMIHTRIDDLIPFLEIFVIPYFLWFFICTCCFIPLFFQIKKRVL